VLLPATSCCRRRVISAVNTEPRAAIIRLRSDRPPGSPDHLETSGDAAGFERRAGGENLVQSDDAVTERSVTPLG
jgi:hypothetical protein